MTVFPITIPAVEVGGSHVTATRVDRDAWTVLNDPPFEQPLDPHGSAPQLLAAIASAASRAEPLAASPLCLAVPGPFDYAAGIARYERVGKFDALRGVDVGAALLEMLPQAPTEITFVNDAVAFTVGEWVAGAAQGAQRVVGITLGTGVGSAFLDQGGVVQGGPRVPPEGRADLLEIDGRPLEDTVSTRAVVHASGGAATGVLDVVHQARAGDAVAQGILRDTYEKLGLALGPWIRRFGADVVVVGGAIVRSWDVIGPLVTSGLNFGGLAPAVRVAAHPQTAPHIGAVWLHLR
jgi:predicted NBD/HSP70 family sugar kinase